MGSFGGTATLATAASASATAAYVLGILGNGAALFLYLSSIPTFVRIYRNRAVGDTYVFPYMAGVLNCLVWSLFGLPSIQRDGELTLAINTIGLVCNVFYMVILLRFAGEEGCFLLCYVLLFEGIVTGCIAVLLFTLPHTVESRTFWLSVCGDLTASLLYVVPVLSRMKLVWDSGTVQHISVVEVTATLLNAAIWTIYAFIPKFKIFTFIPDIAGVAAEMLELIVYYHHNAQAA